MSHATGIIFSKDASPEILGYFDYNGTVDVCLPVIYKTQDELWENWRKGEFVRCSCGGDPTPVWIYSDYGYGFYWAGTACFCCYVITSELCSEVRGETDDYEEYKGRPDGKPSVTR